MAHYEKLEIWKRSVTLATSIYILIRDNQRFSSDFWLRDQIQRSVVSVWSNIAEWCERETKTEFIRFLIIARWSLAEVRTQILIAKNIEYISMEKYTELENELLEIHKMLNAFISSIRKSN